MGLHGVTNLAESVLKTLLRGFYTLSPEIWKKFTNCLATNDGE